MSAFFANRRAHADAEEQEPVTILPAGQPLGFDTVVGSESQISGEFFSSGNVRMDGKFQGSLKIEGNILIGESADICADIDARNISIAGSVRGDVTGHKVQLLRTGRIWGDISASALTTEEGAFIDGKIAMVGHAAMQSEALDVEQERGSAISSSGPSDEASEQEADSLDAGETPRLKAGA